MDVNSGAPNLPAPRPSATVAVVRDGAAGLEVLLLQRAERGDHNSGAWVFPGGLIDPADATTPCEGLDDIEASRRLGVARGGLAAHVAAIRECFEEAGLLFATGSDGRLVTPQGEQRESLAALRAPLKSGAVTLAQVCERFSMRLVPGRLHYVAHWITPVGRAKRFDTRFFVAVLPPGQVSAHDQDETLDQVWIRPGQALAPENTRRLMTPTRAVLKLLGRFNDTTSLLEWAAKPRQVECVLPRLGSDGDELRPVLPHEPAWHEIGYLDPTGRGHVQHRLHAGAVTRLSERLIRVTAEDGESHSYLIGDAASNAWAVLGPASADEAHLNALVAAAPGSIERIVGSAGRTDAAAALAHRTRASLLEADAPQAALRVGTTTLQCLRSGSEVQVVLPQDAMLVGGSRMPEALRDLPDIDWIAPSQGFLRPATLPAPEIP